jgi:hypothetical protein
LYRKLIIALAIGALVAPLAAAASPSRTISQPISFLAPVRLTPITGVGGYEPTAMTDSGGNIWVTAHKPYQFTAGALDAGSPAGVRNASWLWVSTDGGKHFANPPGAYLQGQNLIVGDEADLAQDAAGHVFFNDLQVTSQTIAEWTVKGHQITYNHTTVQAIAQPGDDRPWIAGSGNGTVLEVSHPTSTGNNLGENTGGDGFGAGGSNVSVSLDGGRTLRSSRPYVLRDSEICRPWSDRTPGSKKFTVLCQGANSDKLYSFTSPDLGVHWYRHDIAALGDTKYALFFSIGQYKGTLYALTSHNAYSPAPSQDPVDATIVGGASTGSTVSLLTSTDFGVHWAVHNITPSKGAYVEAALAVSPTGTLGLASYYRPNPSSDWHILAATFQPGQTPRMTDVSPGTSIAAAAESSPQGDFIQNSFDAAGHQMVVWNSEELRNTEPTTTLSLGKIGRATVLFARQR